MAPSHTNPRPPEKAMPGIPFFNTDARIIDPTTLEELPQGQQGEIIIHGPQVFQGYWKDPGKTKDAFISMMANRFSAPVISAISMRKAISSIRTA